MFDLSQVTKTIARDDKGYNFHVSLDGAGHGSRKDALAANKLTILATISNSLERIADAQEQMRDDGQEALAKSMDAANAVMEGLKI